MDTIAELLTAATRTTARRGRGELRAPRVLQSWPGIVHGGGVVALLDTAARQLGVPEAPRILEGRLTSSLPLDTALRVDSEPWQDGVTLTIMRGPQVASSGTIRPLGGAGVIPRRWPGGVGGITLPMSDDCLACGARNPVGLRAALRFDDEGVWASLTPGRAWSASPTRLAPAVVPVLLDELAWWLGALVAQEGGLTNRIDVTLLDPDLPLGELLVAAGRFADVTPIDRKPTFWRVECALTTSGAVRATGSIVFRGGAEYSAQQLPYFRARTAPDVFRRMFPSHAG